MSTHEHSGVRWNHRGGSKKDVSGSVPGDRIPVNGRRTDGEKAEERAETGMKTEKSRTMALNEESNQNVAADAEETGEASGERTLEENFALLDQKIAQLENSEISLEDSFRVYKEGMELLRECSAKIDTVEKKMLQINQDGTITEFGI